MAGCRRELEMLQVCTEEVRAASRCRGPAHVGQEPYRRHVSEAESAGIAN